MQAFQPGSFHLPVARPEEEAAIWTALLQVRPVLVVAPGPELPVFQLWASIKGVRVTRVTRISHAQRFLEERSVPQGAHLFLVDQSAYPKLFRIFISDAVVIQPRASFNKRCFDQLHTSLACRHHPVAPFPPVEVEAVEIYSLMGTLGSHLEECCATGLNCGHCKGEAAFPREWVSNRLSPVANRPSVDAWLSRWVKWASRLDGPGALTRLLQGTKLLELYKALEPGVSLPAFRYLLHETCIPAGLVRTDASTQLYRLTLLGQVVSEGAGDWKQALMSAGRDLPLGLLLTDLDRRHLAYRLWATILGKAGAETIPAQLAQELNDTIKNVRPPDSMVSPEAREWLQTHVGPRSGTRVPELELLDDAIPTLLSFAGQHLVPYEATDGYYAEFLFEALPICPAIGLGLACTPEVLTARGRRMENVVNQIASNSHLLATALRMLDMWERDGRDYAQVRARWLAAWLGRCGTTSFQTSSAQVLLAECRPSWAGAPGSPLWRALNSAVDGALAYRVSSGMPDVPTNIEQLSTELVRARAERKRVILIILDGLGWLTWEELRVALPAGAQLRAQASLVGMGTTTRDRMPEIAELVAPEKPESFWTLFKAPEPEEDDAAAIMDRAGTLHVHRRYLDLLSRLGRLQKDEGMITVYVSIGDRVCTSEGLAPATVYSELLANLYDVLAPHLDNSVFVITADHGLTPTIHDPEVLSRVKESWGVSGLEGNRVICKVPRSSWTATAAHRPGLAVLWGEDVYVSMPAGLRRDSTQGLAYTHGGFSCGESFVPVAVVWKENT